MDSLPDDLTIQPEKSQRENGHTVACGHQFHHGDQRRHADQRPKSVAKNIVRMEAAYLGITPVPASMVAWRRPAPPARNRALQTPECHIRLL